MNELKEKKELHVNEQSVLKSIPGVLPLNEALASSFPGWDMLPPETMVKRNGSRFT